MNKVILTGRIINEIELMKSKSGKEYVHINLMVKKEYKNKDGMRENEFFNVTAYNNNAEFASKYLSKDINIEVEGVLHNSQYRTKNGDKINLINIKAEKILLPYKTKSDSNNTNSIPVQGQSNIEDEDENKELLKFFEDINNAYEDLEDI